MRIWRDEIEAGEFSWWDRDLNFGRPWEFGEEAGSKVGKCGGAGRSMKAGEGMILQAQGEDRISNVITRHRETRAQAQVHGENELE